jgi:hypothetical protein
MNSTELKDLFRDEMEDLAEPYLWSDALVYSYADDAQKMFCRLTDGLADVSTPKVVNLAIVPGASFLPTHKSILKFRGATRSDDGRRWRSSTLRICRNAAGASTAARAPCARW